MSRVARFGAALVLLATAGCCAGPCRFYENAYGFNNPETDRFAKGPPPPVTTPPGMTTQAVQPLEKTLRE